MTNRLFQPLNSFFDRIYVLTLQRAKERQSYMQEALKGLNFHFFQGIDGRNLRMENLIRSGLFDRQSFMAIKRGNREMSVGEVACALSHRAIYEDAVQNGYGKILILEDDARPIRAQILNSERWLQELPSDWQLFMLGYTAEKKPGLYHWLQQRVYLMYHKRKWFNWDKVSEAWIRQSCLRPHNGFYWELGKIVGGHAYALTLETAKRFLRYQTPIKLQADRVFYHFKVEKGLKAYLPKQRLFGLSEQSHFSYIGYDSVRGLDGLAKKYLNPTRLWEKEEKRKQAALKSTGAYARETGGHGSSRRPNATPLPRKASG